MFVDRAKITVISGKGGNGAVTFRREPFVPEGGPDGGDGGRGGSVIFRADSGLSTLMDFRYKKKYVAESGQDGMKSRKSGKSGKDLIIRVPSGTVVIDEESGLVMGDLVENGETVVAARGGKGGKGNVRFKTSVRQAPNFAEAGEAARERTVILELKMIADVGLVGLPNVGKSSLLAVSTNSSPKIGDYPFTTITPNLGVVEIHDRSFVMADIAGIIEGAHEGLGLGLTFLKHIERTRVLIHMVDVSGIEGRDPVDDFEKVNAELAAYGHGISDKPMLVCANKIDLTGGVNSPEYQRFKEYAEGKGYSVFPLSAPLHEGVQELLDAALSALENEDRRLAETAAEPARFFDFEKEEHDPDYDKVFVTKEGESFVCGGRKLRKIFDSTNFNDTGSIRYLYRYLEKSGAVKKMKEMGLKEGDTVRIEDFEFEYIDEYE